MGLLINLTAIKASGVKMDAKKPEKVITKPKGNIIKVSIERIKEQAIYDIKVRNAARGRR